MRTVRILVRGGASALVAVSVFLATMTATCTDQGGVSSWERCKSWVGLPIVEWPGGDVSILFPMALGLGAGTLIWIALGFSSLGRRLD